MKKPSLVEMALRSLNREYRGGSRFWMPKEDAREILRGTLGTDFESVREWRDALLAANFDIGDAGTPEAFDRTRHPKFHAVGVHDDDSES